MERGNVTTDILTIDEARRRLPRIRPHVVTLMEISTELVDLNNTLENLAHRSGDHETERQRMIARSRELMKGYETEMKAINELGATIKDPTIGLLDFYSWKDDDLVFLCWKFGEDTIRWWHRLDSGFQGRRPVEA
jgi:hypothetical protein